MGASIFIQLSIIIVVTLIFAAILMRLKQPTILAYILAGIIIGPSAFNFLAQTEIFEIFSHLGVGLLLFMVGMQMNPKVIKDVGLISLLTGVSQFLVAGIIGFLIATVLGFTLIGAIYIGVALTFSSTIIVLKMLSDSNETETLYGKVAIGFLIVQDILAVAALVIVNILDNSVGMLNTFAILSIDVLGLGLVVYLLAKYILPKIAEEFAHRSEYLFLFALAWCFSVASFFVFVGLSIEVGALVAGIALSISPYRQEMSSKLTVLRDFFLILFFVMLGSQIDFSVIYSDWLAIVIFSLFILIFNPFVVLVTMGLLGYTKRTAFFSGVLVSQISEFSLIFIAVGVTVGHISPSLISDITMIGLITIAGSSYFIKFKHPLFKLVEPYLDPFFKRSTSREEFGSVPHTKEHKVILFGASRVGSDLLETFQKQKNKCLVVEYNPDTIKHVKKKHVDVLYGDAQDATLLESIDFTKVKMVALTISDADVNKTVIKHVRKHNSKAILICVSNTVSAALELYELGATYVIMPHYLGGKHTSLMVEEYGFTQKHFLKERFLHIDHLKKNGHRYPR